MARTHIHRLEDIGRSQIVEGLTHHIHARGARAARKHQDARGGGRQEGREFGLDVGQAGRGANLASGRGDGVLHETSESVAHLTRVGQAKGNHLVTGERATHRDGRVDGQLIETVRAQKRCHAGGDALTVASQVITVL